MSRCVTNSNHLITVLITPTFSRGETLMFPRDFPSVPIWRRSVYSLPNSTILDTHRLHTGHRFTHFANCQTLSRTSSRSRARRPGGPGKANTNNPVNSLQPTRTSKPIQDFIEIYFTARALDKLAGSTHVAQLINL
ncbi:hypothetical protein J6590_015438 [Homalodisca vitripennis]|nr:hypothetical protein J6590_015438 [Homalodisca vitripennis]